MSAKRWLAILTGIALVFGSACFAVQWISVVGSVSGWTGLPQYESQIPALRMYAMLWESLTIALLIVAAFVVGLGKQARSDQESPGWGIVFNYLGRLGLCTIGAIGFVFLLTVLF